jgi:hypothetical protein
MVHTKYLHYIERGLYRKGVQRDCHWWWWGDVGFVSAAQSVSARTELKMVQIKHLRFRSVGPWTDGVISVYFRLLPRASSALDECDICS